MDSFQIKQIKVERKQPHDQDKSNDFEQEENLEINLLVLLMRIFETVDMHDKCKLNY